MSRASRVAPAAESRGRPLLHSILELIWRERQISRADIARQTGLSRSTVSDVVSTLLLTGLVAEGEDGPSRGGRRPILLEFRDDAHVILGVDMGATHVSVVLTDLRGRVLDWEHRDHPVRTDPEGTEGLIRAFCDACLTRNEGARKRLLGVGLAVPSPVDSRNPERLSDVVLPAWRGHGVLDRLGALYGLPISVDNDANLGALAEHWWGAGRGVEDFAYIKLGTGVGSGHIIRGEIYRGSTGTAGEIGHLSIDAGGDACVCGNRGCLATFVGSKALVERAVALLADYPDSPLNGIEVTIGALEDAALEDDPLAMTVVREAGRNLGKAVAGVLNLMNPAAVILGGSLSRLGGRLLVPLRESVLRRTLVSSVAASEIRTSELGPRAIAVGAATLVLDGALSNPRIFPGIAAA